MVGVTQMNPKLAFVVFGSLYLIVMVASYLVSVSYLYFAPYGLFLLPAIANFCIGYFTKDVYKAIKIIIVGSSLQASMLLALLYSSSLSHAFFGLVPITSYYTIQVPLGIVISLAGTVVREDRSDIIVVCTHLVEKTKQIIKEAISEVRRYI